MGDGHLISTTTSRSRNGPSSGNISAWQCRLAACEINRRFRLLILHPWLMVLLATLGCQPGIEVPKPAAPQALFEKLQPQEIPEFKDDMGGEQLKAAIDQSLTFLNKIPPSQTFPLGNIDLRADRLKETLLLFEALRERGALNKEAIARHFEVYRSRSVSDSGQSLVTGYYEPILNARMKPDRVFHYPLYGPPPDLIKVELSLFDADKYKGARLTGRLDGNRLVPYYSRDEIDRFQKIKDCRCQLAWLEDPIEGFFLHIQGSGMLRMGDGRLARVGYAAANGHPYRSLGKLLIEKGIMPAEAVTLQSIKEYLKAHPDERDAILSQNPSYVFFRWVEAGPMGSLNVVLTAGRSIAMDHDLHPKGGLAFLVTRQPRVDADGHVLGEEPLQRWVLNQDTGGAIKGIGRVDLFCGSGEPSGALAGNMKHQGNIYFLIKKEN